MNNLLLLLIAFSAMVNTAMLTAAPTGVGVSTAPFGETRDGQAVEMFTIHNANGLTAKVITYGAIIYSLEVPDKVGVFTNVTINRETVRDYEAKSACFGALLGRYANRTGKAQFSIAGQNYALPKNNGGNHIHGGIKGL